MKNPSSDLRPRDSSDTKAERLAQGITRFSGSTLAFGLALAIVVAWAFSGPVFHYSDTWQLVMNTASSITTLLMVFLIQRAQNKDALAIHVKLNEIIKAIKGTSNHDFRLRRSLCDRQPRDFKGPPGPWLGFDSLGRHSRSECLRPKARLGDSPPAKKAIWVFSPPRLPLH